MACSKRHTVSLQRWRREYAYLELRRHMEMLWDIVSKPVKIPARRRRADRELPKAA
jgi:hypothetical protein